MSKSWLVLRHFFCGALLGVICLLAPLQAEAACASSDRAGTWQFNFSLVEEQEGYWLACTVIVKSSGKVKSGTSCLGGAPGGSGTTFNFSTTGGSLSVGRSCAVKGNVKIAGCPFKFHGATMSKDGQKIAGVGSECGGSATGVFGFMALKR